MSQEGPENSEKAPPQEAPPARPFVWSKRAAARDDALLGCLEVLSTLLDRPLSAAAMTAGLPLEDDRLTPATFIRAAQRAGISARLVRKKIDDISPFTLPCVLLLAGNKACILTEIPQGENVCVIFPESGLGLTQMSRQNLDELYTGFTLFAKPAYLYDARSAELTLEKPGAWFWGVLWKFWPIYAKVIFAAVLINVFAISAPLFTMNVYDRVLSNYAIDTLIVLSIGIGIIFVFDFLLKTLRVIFVDSAGKNADLILASRLLEHVMGMRLAARPMSAGGFANQLREFETLREFFSSATLVALADVPFIFFFLGVIYLIGGAMVWVPLIAIPLVIIGSLVIHTPLSNWVRRAFREGSQKHALLVETILGLETIKTFGAEGRIQRNWEHFVAQTAHSGQYLHLFSALAINWAGLIQQVAYVGTVIVGVFLVEAGSLSMGGLIACSILASRAMAPLSQVVTLLTRFHQSKAALEALDKILQLPSERAQGRRFLHRPHLSGHVEFKDVSFTYPHQKTSALRQVSLTIQAGEKVGVLGRIGSGKSTLQKLLLNLYEVDEGSILLDDTDIRQIDPADLRHNIGYVPQDIFLFFGSVRDNIVFGASDVSDEAVLRAAELSGVMDFVKAHPQGFDRPVGEGGCALSGGQRQAIAIARALIRDPSFLLMDEPTAMMDHFSEARFIHHLEKALDHKTMLLVTHRVPLLRLVTRLLVVDNGKIIADGPRDEVLNVLRTTQLRSL